MRSWFGLILVFATVFIFGGLGRWGVVMHNPPYIYVIEKGRFPVFLKDFVKKFSCRGVKRHGISVAGLHGYMGGGTWCVVRGAW